jgi:heme-degrading monooxygenase HmoA
MNPQRIRHQVIFCLKSGRGEAAERFLADGRRDLTSIPGVQAFHVFRQVSPKNDYDFGFSMEFADQSAYEAYNAHPVHTAFVRDRWQTEVSRFLEIDFREV